MLNRDEAHLLRSAWQGKRVGVWGDLMLDRYIWGQASRISQEAPIPVVRAQRTTSSPGGAANVLNNLAALGACPVAFGVTGADEAGETLRGALADKGIGTAGVVTATDRCTTEKTRVVAGNQQVVRVDHEVATPLDEETRQALREKLLDAIAGGALDALIIEDYAKGAVDAGLAEEVAAAAQAAGCPVALDPHPGNQIACGGLTVMTPNRAEAFAMAGHFHTDPISPVSEDDALHAVAEKLLGSLEPACLLITLGGQGMAMFRPGEPMCHIHTRAQEVFDVSGAGDTVIATLVLAMLAGADAAVAAEVANHAAGIVVGKVGTVPVDQEELVMSFPGA
jgi:D-beta-D-heptose 7-phosphate kinase/D-beta-D-heptose 1-phosphate adenosyltransferase